MIATKACPVVLRRIRSETEFLSFMHPRAGLQLVKGTIEPGETSEVAALRELAEESGITAASVVKNLGIWCSGYERQIWTFHLVEPHASLAEFWVHDAPDDGGLRLRFFWHKLNAPLSSEWHPVFQGAIKFIQNVV